MLYMDGAPLSWDLLVATWTHSLPEAINRSLREMVSFSTFAVVIVVVVVVVSVICTISSMIITMSLMVVMKIL